MAGLVWPAARRRGHCSIEGIRRMHRRLLALPAVAARTHVAFYAATTWLGSLAS